jgi:hypothetical protein
MTSSNVLKFLKALQGEVSTFLGFFDYFPSYQPVIFDQSLGMFHGGFRGFKTEPLRGFSIATFYCQRVHRERPPSGEWRESFGARLS